MYEFTATLWLHDGDAAWHFITVPEDISDEIEFRTSGLRSGFGSVRVDVTIGSSRWETSLFPDSKRDAYVLPVKKAVRTKEGVEAGDTVEVVLRLDDDPPIVHGLQ